MSGTVPRVSENSARSDTSFEDAVNVGLDRANATLRNVKSAWIKEQSVDMENGVIVGYRVNLLSSPSFSSSKFLGLTGACVEV